MIFLKVYTQLVYTSIWYITVYDGLWQYIVVYDGIWCSRKVHWHASTWYNVYDRLSNVCRPIYQDIPVCSLSLTQWFVSRCTRPAGPPKSCEFEAATGLTQNTLSSSSTIVFIVLRFCLSPPRIRGSRPCRCRSSLQVSVVCWWWRVLDLKAHALDWAFVGHLLGDTASSLHLDTFVVRRQGQAQFVVKLGQGHGFLFLAFIPCYCLWWHESLALRLSVVHTEMLIAIIACLALSGFRTSPWCWLSKRSAINHNKKA